MTCPYCESLEGQVKCGTNSGNQRYQCKACGRRYTPEPRERGYSPTLREEAVALHAGGIPTREIADRLGVTTRSIANWVRRANQGDTAEAVPPTNAARKDIEPLAARKRRATIHDVASRAHVSITTISNYLNSKGRMSGATSRRIQRAIDELHFTPSFLIRAIRESRTDIIGVVVFGLGTLDFELSLTPQILTGIDTAAEAHERDILLYTNAAEHSSRISARRFLDGHIDGLVWVAPELNEPLLEQVAKAGLPVVALLSRHVPDNVGFVNVDNIQAMHLLVQHLADLGHRRIAYVGPVPKSDFIDRRDGYRLATHSLGLKQDPGFEIVPEEDIWNWASYVQRIEPLLARRDRPTAIMASDDGLAAALIPAVRARGLRVPQDIAITGFNDFPNSRMLGEEVTTIRQNFREIGRLGAERLIALIDGAPVEECRVTIPPELVVRATSVAP